MIMRTGRFAACFAAFAILISSVIETNAAGALAMGRCGAFGYAFDDVSPEAAAQRARAQCKGHECRVVTSFRRACAALAVDAGNACGPYDIRRARSDEKTSAAVTARVNAAPNRDAYAAPCAS